MNNDNIYQIKIDQFINITQESDIEIAKKYLMKYNWNVEDAVSNYLNYQFNNSQLKSNKNSASVRTNNNSSINRQEKKETDSGFFFGMVKNFLNFGGLFDNNQTNFTNIYSNNNNNNSNIIQENLNRNNNNRNIIQENLNRNNNDSNIIQENLNRNNNNIVVTNDDSSEILKLFDFISSREKNYKNFLNKLKEKPGLIICFNENSLGNLYVLVESIKNEDYLIDMIDHSLSLHLINSASSEFKELSKFFTFNKLPSIIYINKTQLNAITIENVFLIDDNTSIEYFRETIFNQINDPKNNPSAEVIYNEQNINYPIRDSDLINYQNQELKELERQAEEEKRREIKEGFERQKKIEEEKKQVQEKEQTKKLLMSKITKEPDENDPDAYLVAFRSPHNNLRKERRFKKTDKIQVLYDYVKSLSEEFEVQEFSLFKPFLGNLENKEKTLEEEKLSNALLQIKEL